MSFFGREETSRRLHAKGRAKARAEEPRRYQGSASQGFGESSSESNPQIVSPYGNAPYTEAAKYRNQYANPLNMGLGFGDPNNPRYQNYLSTLYGPNAANGPTADYIRQAREFLPGVFGEASNVGNDIATRAPQLFGGMMDQVNQYLAGLTGEQNKASGQLGQAGQEFTNASGIFGKGGAVDRSKQAMDQAFSALPQQTLYQQQLREALLSSQSGAAGRGLLTGGGQQGVEDTISRDLAVQGAQNQFANQQAAIQGNLGAVGTGVGAMETARQGEAQALQLLDQLRQAGIAPTQAALSMLPSLASGEAARYTMPMDALNSVSSVLGGAQSPVMSLLSMIGPQIASASRSKGLQLSNSMGGGL